MQLFRKIQVLIGLWYARWRLRNQKDFRQDFTSFMREARSILVVLPMVYEEAAIAGQALKKLIDGRSDLHLTIVTTGVRATPLNYGRADVIRIDDVDLTPLFLPRSTVLHRVVAHQYDLAVDLNLDFVLHAAYICKASRAPIRVGVRKNHGETFFNVELRVDRSGSPQLDYSKFIELLSMF